MNVGAPSRNMRGERDLPDKTSVTRHYRLFHMLTRPPRWYSRGKTEDPVTESAPASCAPTHQSPQSPTSGRTTGMRQDPPPMPVTQLPHDTIPKQDAVHSGPL